MRIVEFRFWLGHTKKMTYEHSLYDIAHFNWDFTDDIIPLQFSGEFDKFDVKIFESDIVKCSYGTGKVVFKNGCFMVEWLDDSDAYIELLFSRDKRTARTGDDMFAVIGNIYEYPELLTTQITTS